MKSIIRSLILLLLATTILLSMHHYELIDFNLVLQAFRSGRKYVVALALSNVLLFLLLALRYLSLVRATGVKVQKRDAFAATFVSFAVGQWAPGSIAVQEMIRMGLMFGSNAQTRDEEIVTSSNSGVRARLIAASLSDRLIGFWVMLSIGSLFAFGLLFWQLSTEQVRSQAHLVGLTALAVASLGGSIAILILPSFAGSRLARNMMNHLLHCFAYETALHTKPTATTKMRRRIHLVLRHLDRFRELLVEIWMVRRYFMMPIFISCLIMFLNSFCLYFAALAIGAQVPFACIMATYAFIALSALLPLGFGGIGGYQLIVAAVFQIFGVESVQITSANLLSNAMSLLVCTILGIIFAKISYQQLREILLRKRAAEPGV